MSFRTQLIVAVGALAVEAAIGYPRPLERAIGHPVVWIGAMIGWLDRRTTLAEFAARSRRRNGVFAIGCVVLVVVAAVTLLQWVLQWALSLVGAVALLALLASTLIAQRSLHQHVAAVAEALERGGLEAARRAVAHVVGRNPAFLDEAGVARAAIESLAENFSDAVVAPALWCGLFGLPAIAAYKAINTADSMIGHRTARYAAFGWAAARLDDAVNLPASRLSVLWLVLAAWSRRDGDARGARLAVRRDARRHRSPNAGWPEAAMAGALGLRLAGPRVYGDALVDDAWMGEGRAEVTAADVRRALALYRTACALQFVVLAAIAAAIAPG